MELVERGKFSLLIAPITSIFLNSFPPCSCSRSGKISAVGSPLNSSPGRRTRTSSGCALELLGWRAPTCWWTSLEKCIRGAVAQMSVSTFLQKSGRSIRILQFSSAGKLPPKFLGKESHLTIYSTSRAKRTRLASSASTRTILSPCLYIKRHAKNN